MSRAGFSIFSLVALLLAFHLSALQVAAQQTINGNQSLVPSAWTGTQIPNASSAGTTLNSLAKINSSGQAVITATTDTSGIFGVVVSGAGTAGNATVAQTGQVQCNFDSGGATAGHFVINSTLTAGDCADGGTVLPSSQIFGYVVSGGSGSGLYTIALAGGSFVPSSASFGLTTDNTWTTNNRFKGSDPWADVSAFARARPSAPEPTTTATCTAGMNTCTFASASGFLVGDGVTIRGAGATLTMSTPSGPTVTPSLSVGGMALGGGNYASNTTVASATGASTYSYELIARDQSGGYTAPSAATVSILWMMNAVPPVGAEQVLVAATVRLPDVRADANTAERRKREKNRISRFNF